MNKASAKPVIWASMGPDENKHLSDLLSLASSNYGRHNDWFMRHHERAINNLAAILAAEAALISFAATHEKIPGFFTTDLLIGLACTAIILACLGVFSCRRSFRAGLENLYMMANVAWAMGVTTNVAVNESTVIKNAAPDTKRHHCEDESLYVPRWLNGCLAHETCEKFVNHTMRNWKSTLNLTNITILLFGLGACAFAVAGVIWTSHRGR